MAPAETSSHEHVPGLVDLAARRLGGLLVATNDEFFGAADHLIDAAEPVFDPLAFTARGKLMDGWETRRRRDVGHDWCVIRLGVHGVVHQVVVDTTHFRGNHPQAVEVEGTACPTSTVPDDAEWFPLVDRRPVRGDTAQAFPVASGRRVTHVRLTIHPDGGVARLRVMGRPLVDLHGVADPRGRLDLAALVNGGRAAACSDEFFADATNLIMVGDARDMGDGWETRRRRREGHDWVVVELATTGIVERVEVDTTHFLGNHPDRCIVDVVHAPGLGARNLGEDEWTTIVGPAPLQSHARHVLGVDERLPATHLRLSLVPDGGVARLRAFGRVSDDGWRRSGTHLLDAFGPDEAARVLAGCCGSRTWVDQMVARRPFREPDAVHAAADEAHDGLAPDDHLEAFAAHPRIGERSDSATSNREQAGTRDADPAVLERLHAGNLAYEERFGHVFLIRAAGRSADEMLEELEVRLDHDAQTELAVAAEQQREITHLRLDALLRDGVRP